MAMNKVQTTNIKLETARVKVVRCAGEGKNRLNIPSCDLDGLAASQAFLRILQTTDLHMYLQPYDYYADKPSDGVGLARTASLIHQARAEAPNCLLFDNGDFLQGNPLGEYLAKNHLKTKSATHPCISLLNGLNYTAATLGNHEFSYGLDYLAETLKGSRFPVVCANIVNELAENPTEDQTLFAPYVLLDREIVTGNGNKRKLCLGVIGFAPPQVVHWDHDQLAGRVKGRDIIETARAYVPEMKAKGADIIIGLCHSGIGADTHVPDMENAAVPLAAVDGIDVILAGHTHLTFPGPGHEYSAAVDPGAGTIHGKPAVMAGFWGSHLGVIDLLIEHSKSGWQIRGHNSAVRPISKRGHNGAVTALVEDDPDVIAQSAHIHAATLKYIRRPLGETTRPLHSYFSLVHNDPSLALIADAQHAHVKAVLLGSEHAEKPLLSAVAPFKAGGRSGPDYYADIAIGMMNYSNAADLYIYPNTIATVEISGADVLEWLERSASIFCEITAGITRQPLHDPAFPSYLFDVLHGLSYEFDLCVPARYYPDGSLRNSDSFRVQNICFQGKPIAPQSRFLVATNSYRLGGGGGFGALADARIIYAAPVGLRDILIGHIAKNSPLTPKAENVWSFSPKPDTGAVFQTCTNGLAHLHDIHDRRIEPLGNGGDGLHDFRLHF